MKFKSKVLIAFVAVVITFLGFSLMSSTAAVELARADQEVNLDVTYSDTKETEATLHYFFFIVG